MRLCDYGCGKEAKYKFKNEKWCCSKKYRSCPTYREMFKGEKNPFYGKHHTPETKQKLREYRNNQECPRKGKFHTKETKKKISISHKGKKLSEQTKEKIRNYNKRTIKKIKELYSTFSQIEEMRYDPENPKNIQMRCKNHNCKNSKEKDGWFTPESRQIEQRIQAIENHGKDNCYFYCSSECKNTCPLFRSDPKHYLKKNKKTEKTYTTNEYQQFREFVLKRDNYKCQYCAQPAEHVHHERPQKLEPFFALDPDLAWSVCKKCHYEKGHKDECLLIRLANIDCIKGDI